MVVALHFRNHFKRQPYLDINQKNAANNHPLQRPMDISSVSVHYQTLHLTCGTNLQQVATQYSVAKNI